MPKASELNVFRFKTKVASTGDIWRVLVPAKSLEDALDILYGSDWFLEEEETVIEVKRLEIKSLAFTQKDESDEMVINVVE